MVFYRKYRPQKIDDLDSASVRETLNAVLQKDTPHAFLFTGPKGLGKTSTARIVAKVVNCLAKRDLASPDAKNIEPCNKCDQCVSITNGNNVDILEIDAASNRGIDEIRDLKEKIRLAPVAAKRKVYIIDEVHMLTTEAFNALLKTLEEPPEHAMFILCTTEAHKVPETIVSRCFQIMFKPATEEELVRSFKRIVAGENLKIDDEALKVIASMADGGFRDGVKVLEEVSLLSHNKPITKEIIENSYKTSSVLQSSHDFLLGLNNRQAKECLRIIQELVNQGVDIKYFLTQVLLELHYILLRNLGLSETNKIFFGDLKFQNEEVRELSELFSKAYLEMKTSVLPQLSLELAVIQWCEVIQNHAKQNAEPRTEAPQEPARPEKSYVAQDTEVSVSTLRKQVGTIKKLKALYGEKKTEPAEEEIAIITTSVELMQTNGDGPVTKEWMELFWRNLVSEMKKYNHTVAGVLRGCTIKSFADQQLIIQTAYKFHKERLDDMKNREALLQICKLLTGKDIEITVELRK